VFEETTQLDANSREDRNFNSNYPLNTTDEKENGNMKDSKFMLIEEATRQH